MQVIDFSCKVVFITLKSSKEEVGRENQRLRGGAPVGKHTVPLQRPGSQPSQAAQPGETYHILLSSQAGLRADGAGESALPAEESPSAGTGRARTLRILQENSIDFIMGAGEEASLYLPWS